MSTSTDSFDPMSSANTTALALLCVGACCVASASYMRGKLSFEKDAYQYQASTLTLISGGAIILAAMFIFWGFD